MRTRWVTEGGTLYVATQLFQDKSTFAKFSRSRVSTHKGEYRWALFVLSHRMLDVRERE